MVMKATNIKFENNGKKKKKTNNVKTAVLQLCWKFPDHAQSFVSVRKVWLNKLTNCFYWSVR